MSAWPERMNRRTIVSMIVVFLVTACGREPQLSVLFETDLTVAKGNDVVYDGVVIGKVAKTSVENGGARVHLAVSDERIEVLHKGSAAIMTTRGGSPAVEIYDRGGGDALSDGDELVALNNSLEYLAWQAGKTVDTAHGSLNEMTESLRNYLNGEEWARQREEMEESLEQLGVDAEQAMGQMQDDYDAMIEELEAKTEESRELAQKHYDQLSANVQKQLEVLMKNGKEAVAEPLQRLSESLESLMQKYSAENSG